MQNPVIFNLYLMERYGCNSNINEPLFHYYFLLQCTLRYRINTPSPPVYVGVFSPTFQSRTFLFQACLFILSDMLDRIFSKKGNFLSLKCFEVSFYWQRFRGCLSPHLRKSTSTFWQLLHNFHRGIPELNWLASPKS